MKAVVFVSNITSWSTGRSYAPPVFDSLRSLYQKLVPLHRARYQSVRHAKMTESNIECFLAKVVSRGDLSDVENDVLRMLEIYGELSADGTEAYFERRWVEYRDDMSVFKKHRLDELVECFEKYRLSVFGSQVIDASEAWNVLESLIEVGPSSKVDDIDNEIIDKIELIYLKAAELVVLEK